MPFCDFVCKYDPKNDTGLDLTKRILYSIVIRARIRNNKPAVMFIGGDSGEGKSFAALRLQEILMEVQGLNAMDYIDVMNVYTPLEYPTKLRKILYEKEYKKANILTVHESRNLVKAKQWHNFVNQAIPDINAMSRKIKRLCIIIISQFIRDITNDMRYTLNFYGVVRRPQKQKARLYLNILWKDDRDLEKPKLKKRRIWGYLVYPNGQYRKYMPKYLELSKPSEEIQKIFDKRDLESKSKIINKKMEKLIQEMEKDIGVSSKKIDTLVDHYTENLGSIPLIAKRYRGKFKVLPKFREMHSITTTECEEFEEKLKNKIEEKQKPIIPDIEEDDL